MKHISLPNGFQLPALGLGTWNMGGGFWSRDVSQEDKVYTAIRHALDIGYTHIDTAEMYADGYAEELTGRAVRDSGVPREKLFITTKVWHTNLAYADVHKAMDGSLRHLGVDYVDLYLIHWPNESVPLDETFRALNEIAASEKARFIGVSNFNLPQLKQAQELSETPILTNQVPYSLTNRTYVQNGVLEYCQENDILLTAYTPIEKGKLKSHPVLETMAQKHHATPIQIALAWLIQQKNVITIPMSTNPKNISTNFAAGEIILGDEDMATLNKVV